MILHFDTCKRNIADIINGAIAIKTSYSGILFKMLSIHKLLAKAVYESDFTKISFTDVSYK